MLDDDFLTTESYKIRTCPTDQKECSLDLNHYLIHNPEATYFLRFRGASIPNARIHNGDLLVVDRSVHAACGNYAIVVFHSGFKIGQIVKAGILFGKTLNNSEDLEIWGVVTCVINKL